MPVPEPQRIEKVRSRWYLPRLVAPAVMATTIISVGMFKAIRAYQIWSASERLPRELPKQPVPPAEAPPDPYVLRLKYPREIESAHLLDGDFAIVNQMSDLTGACQDILQSSFVNYWDPSAPRRKVAFANPGEDFEETETDVLREGLPFRRLVFAGLASERCFVYFETGGRRFPATCLAVVGYTQEKAIWVGEWVGQRSRKVANIKELRYKLSRHQFTGEDQPGC